MKFQKKSEKRFIKNAIRFTAILILLFIASVGILALAMGWA